MAARLAVADPDRGPGTLCLAVSPALKALGVANRCRIYEIPSALDYITAPPQMQLYIQFSAQIYGIYLKYIAKEDILVYSIDEAFLDVTPYLALYQKTPRELARTIMDDIRCTLGIPAACGIGTNLYLAKAALDIRAKHSPDSLAFLDEDRYCKTLWRHRPLTDFWQVGPGTAHRLERAGIYTMEQIAQANPSLLFRLLGKNAAHLINHAWGREPATLSQIKAYRPKSTSLSSSQILMRDYSAPEGLLILKEMADLLCLELVEKKLLTASLTLQIGYSRDYSLFSQTDGIQPSYASCTLPSPTSSVRLVTQNLAKLFHRTARPGLPIRQIAVTFQRLCPEGAEQYSLFFSPEESEKDRRIQRAVLDIKKRFGKNAVLKGINLEEAATTRLRNTQIGGHKSGI